MRAYDASPTVEWIDSTMYDQPGMADSYDTANCASGISTFKLPEELEFLDMVAALNIRSVLDIGCGAGAFYHLLHSVHPQVKYQGYDLSRPQVERARDRFGDRFAVRDASTITQEEFARYQAVHAYSIFPFMSVPKQIETLRRILRSGAKLLASVGVTRRDVRYVPQGMFKNFGKAKIDGRLLLTAVFFPYRSDLQRLLRHTGHVARFSEGEYPNSLALNSSDRDGAGLADVTVLRRRSQRFERWNPYLPRLRLITANIEPQEWAEKRTQSYDHLSREEIYRLITARLDTSIGKMSDVTVSPNLASIST
jgi:SAM-dependent methyltransferase